jgi:hypothetical protein
VEVARAAITKVVVDRWQTCPKDLILFGFGEKESQAQLQAASHQNGLRGEGRHHPMYTHHASHGAPPDSRVNGLPSKRMTSISPMGKRGRAKPMGESPTPFDERTTSRGCEVHPRELLLPASPPFVGHHPISAPWSLTHNYEVRQRFRQSWEYRRRAVLEHHRAAAACTHRVYQCGGLPFCHDCHRIEVRARA